MEEKTVNTKQGRPLRIILTGGGTAGHINPALAIGACIRKMRPETEILYVGNPGGMEERLVPAAGFTFRGMKVQGIQRQLNFNNIRRNIKAVMLLTTATKRAKAILSDFKPDAVIGTGGYVSGPIVRTAAKMGILTFTHEQNAFPGVTTKLLSRYVDCLFVAFERAKDFLPPEAKDKIIVTGNPVREEFLSANREEARKKLGLDERPCILSFGGSLGARQINTVIAEVIARHAPEGRLQHIHATGRNEAAFFADKMKELGVDLAEYPQIDVRDYINNQADCMAACDLVISRAGAITLCEIEASGRASILIPSPNVAENHQYHNAMVLGNSKAAFVLEEKDLTSDRLYQMIEELAFDKDRLASFSENAKKLAISDSASIICREVFSAADKKLAK